MPVYKSFSVEQTEKIGSELSKSLSGGAVVALFGDLGMGKTTFVRGIVKGLGIEAPVSSPTFALVHEYGGNPAFYHFDMYRINSWDELYSTGFFDYLNENSILAIEWSENIENALPKNHIKVEFEYGHKLNERIITITEREEEHENSCN